MISPSECFDDSVLFDRTLTSPASEKVPLWYRRGSFHGCDIATPGMTTMGLCQHFKKFRVESCYWTTKTV